MTADIRAGAIEGFARHGSNGRGEGGFAGFCFYLAKKHPKAAARIVEKLLPLTVNANGTGFGGPTISTINVVSIPSDHYISAADIAKMRGPVQLEHIPSPEPLPQIEPAELEHYVEPEPEMNFPYEQHSIELAPDIESGPRVVMSAGLREKRERQHEG